MILKSILKLIPIIRGMMDVALTCNNNINTDNNISISEFCREKENTVDVSFQRILN